MTDSLGYRFDPAESKRLAASINQAASGFGPQAQRALQVLALRIPSIGADPLATSAPMTPPAPPPMPAAGLPGMMNAALNPSQPKPESKPQQPAGHIFNFNLAGSAPSASPTGQMTPPAGGNSSPAALTPNWQDYGL